MNLYDMKTNAFNIGQSLKSANEKLAEMTVSPDS